MCYDTFPTGLWHVSLKQHIFETAAWHGVSAVTGKHCATLQCNSRLRPFTHAPTPTSSSLCSCALTVLSCVWMRPAPTHV